MVSTEEVRRCALGLPEAVEADHHGRPSFRVCGKLFATLWDEQHLNVMLDEPGILVAVQSAAGCEELWWGKRLRAVQVHLVRADGATVADLLADAWEQGSPQAFDPLGLI